MSNSTSLEQLRGWIRGVSEDDPHNDEEKIIALFHELSSDAERYRWLKRTDPRQVCAIAWRFKVACAFDEPDQAIDAVLRVDY